MSRSTADLETSLVWGHDPAGMFEGWNLEVVCP